MAVRAFFQIHPRGLNGLAQGLPDPVLPRSYPDHPHRPLPGEAVGQGGSQAGGAVPVQGQVIHGPAPATQVVGEVAHAGQEQGDAGLVTGDMGAFFRYLGHPHPVPSRIEAVQGGAVPVQLVTQDHDQMARAVISHGQLSRAGTRCP